MNVVTVTHRAKNKNGKVVIIREDRDVTQTEAKMDIEATPENIAKVAKEIGDYNLDEEAIFLAVVRSGATGYLNKKYLRQ